MSLLDEAKKEVADPVLAAAQKAGATKKKSNSDYQKRQRAAIAEHAAVLVKFVDSNKNAPEDVKRAADYFAKRGEFERKAGVAGGVAGQPSVFVTLFGEQPKVGTKVTAIDMFNKVHKGYGDMRKLIKKWAEKGNVVEFDEVKQEYTLTKLA